jgi:hypothetical protein
LSIQTDPTYLIGPNSGGEMIFWTKGEQLPGCLVGTSIALCVRYRVACRDNLTVCKFFQNSESGGN